MAEDLVAERKRSAALERENRILRARLEALGDEQTAKSADSSGD